MRRIALWTWPLLIAVAIGCTDIQDYAIAERNRNLAYKAWKAARWDYYRQGVPYCVREHIGRGFRQGFADVAGGGSGRLPLFAPQYYWGPEYQNPRGNEFIAAYFRGYEDGAVAGDRTGLAHYNTLPSTYMPPHGQGQAPNGENVPAEPATEEDLPSADSESDLQLPKLVPDAGAPLIPPPLPPVAPGKQTRFSPDGLLPLGLMTPKASIGSLGGKGVATTVRVATR